MKLIRKACSTVTTVFANKSPRIAGCPCRLPEASKGLPSTSLGNYQLVGVAWKVCIVQVAFLAAMVGPKVAAAAAQRALEVLAAEDPAVAAEAAALDAAAQDKEQTDQDRSAEPGLHSMVMHVSGLA